MVKYISANTVAEIFEVHPESVRKGKGRFGSLTRYKIGRMVRYSVAEVEALASPEAELQLKYRPRLLPTRKPRKKTRSVVFEEIE